VEELENTGAEKIKGLFKARRIIGRRVFSIFINRKDDRKSGLPQRLLGLAARKQ